MYRDANAGYQHARQACYVCLNPHDILDTEVQIEGEGGLAICRGCVRDMALTMGFTVDERSDYEAQIADLKEQAFVAERALADSDVIITTLNRSAQAATQRRMERVRNAKEAPAEVTA